VKSIIQGLWVGGSLSVIEALSIKSFLFHGHKFHLYAYDPIENVPDGALIRDANDILPKRQIYRKRDGSLSSFANLFRWVLLKKLGGIWVDMDVICLRPFDFPDDILFGWESDRWINNAILKFPVNNPFTTIMARACEDVNLFQPIDSERAVIKKILRRYFLGKEKSRVYTRHTEPGGPWYFTRFLDHYDMAHLAKPVECFYPLPFHKWQNAFTADAVPQESIENSYSVHLWNTAYLHTKTNKQNLDLEGTLIGSLRDRYF